MTTALAYDLHMIYDEGDSHGARYEPDPIHSWPILYTEKGLKNQDLMAEK